jgi:hypothetical protein
MPKFHRHSVFGTGPRRPLDREQRARYKFLVHAHRTAENLTADHKNVAEALLRRLGVDGRCDPSQATLADDAGCKERTVRRALVQLRDLGLVHWHQRIVRSGWRVVQTSNAYLLMPLTLPNPVISGLGRRVGAKLRIPRSACPPVGERREPDAIPPPSLGDLAAASAALARRRAMVEARLAGHR